MYFTPNNRINLADQAIYLNKGLYYLYLKLTEMVYT